MPDEFSDARRLGGALAVLARYGIHEVQAALAALRRGEATPEQQRLAATLLDAVAD